MRCRGQIKNAKVLIVQQIFLLTITFLMKCFVALLKCIILKFLDTKTILLFILERQLFFQKPNQVIGPPVSNSSHLVLG